MMSAATAAMAVLMVTLVKDHGLQYLLAAKVLAGLFKFGIRLGLWPLVMRGWALCPKARISSLPPYAPPRYRAAGRGWDLCPEHEPGLGCRP